MKAANIKLPDIWRGCDYPAIVVKWEDSDGNPYNLDDYIPFVSTEEFDIHAAVLRGTEGLTHIFQVQTETAFFPVGQYRWDWIWKHRPSGRILPNLFLRGVVEVKEPLPKP